MPDLLITAEFAARAIVAVLLGAAIGLERHLRSRMAGVRTNALVGCGSSLFVILGAYGFDSGGTDPTRVAAQVVSGIGFLGAGVIMREGLNVRGLNTAATLWCTAAVGSLAGAGLYALAVIGAGTIVVANTVLRPLTRVLTRRAGWVHHPPAATDPSIPQPALYQIGATTQDKSELRIRALIAQELSSPDCRLQSIRSTASKSSTVTVTAEVIATSSSSEAAGLLERAVQRISLDPKVTAVGWQPIETRDEDE